MATQHLFFDSQSLRRLEHPENQEVLSRLRPNSGVPTECPFDALLSVQLGQPRTRGCLPGYYTVHEQSGFGVTRHVHDHVTDSVLPSAAVVLSRRRSNSCYVCVVCSAGMQS